MFCGWRRNGRIGADADAGRPDQERRPVVARRARRRRQAAVRRPAEGAAGHERRRRTARREQVGPMSPVLDASHDLAHPVEGDTAWSESYYFNCYDPDVDCGFFTRVGIRPNEGTIDVGLSVWKPGGGLAHVRHVREEREMVERDLDVGPVRYSLVDPMKRWQLT